MRCLEGDSVQTSTICPWEEPIAVAEMLGIEIIQATPAQIKLFVDIARSHMKSTFIT